MGANLNKLFSIYHKVLLRLISYAILLYYRPKNFPKKEQLQQWNYSNNKKYFKWIFHHSCIYFDTWCRQYGIANKLKFKHKISIITPVYNTDIRFLKECAESVKLQTCPYWEWILVDDNSNSEILKSLLKSSFFSDPRIKVIFSNKANSQGISETTNQGIKAAKGDYILFLDHDDRLAVDTIYLLLKELENKSYDIIYSDRDMILPDNTRDLYLMKPDWSPETLLSGNYIFHLMCYKQKFLNTIGLLNKEFDGSQDYDLVLRASEKHPSVRHIPKILYHWRQHSGSISEDEGAKCYTFTAGISALKASLERREIKAKVLENKTMWRGNYQIHFKPENLEQISVIPIDRDSEYSYKEQIDEAINKSIKSKYLFIIDKTFTPKTKDTIAKMAAWMQFKDVALISGKIVNTKDEIVYAGAYYNKDANINLNYSGYSVTEFGYMGATLNTRNISVVNPYCVMIRVDIWEKLNGIIPEYVDSLGMLDFNFRVLELGQRIIYQAESVFLSSAKEDKINVNLCTMTDSFKSKWNLFLQKGDPYYSPNLRQYCNGMGLDNAYKKL